MNTQNRKGMNLSIGSRLLILVSLGILLAPAGVNAQLARPVVTKFSKTKQEANRLVAMTKPGYYRALLVPDWRVKSQDRTQAIATTADLCRRSKAPAATPSPTLQFGGERLDERQVQLVWKVSQDVNAEEFSVERSLTAGDGGFEPVVFVKSRVSSAQVETYQTVDANTHTDFSYYRLKRVDLNGVSTYSSIVAVKGELPRFTVKAFPSPGQQKDLRFAVASPAADEPVSVAIYDVQGHVLYRHDQAVLDADRQFGLAQAPALRAGLYYVKIITKSQQASTAFIVQP